MNCIHNTRLSPDGKKLWLLDLQNNIWYSLTICSFKIIFLPKIEKANIILVLKSFI